MWTRVWVVAAAGTLASACADDVDTDQARRGALRTYYLAADEVAWDYAPGGNLAGEQFDDTAPIFLENVPCSEPGPANACRIGSVAIKALYRAYTDDTFTTLAPVPPGWEHLGALGPLIRAEVGDTVHIVFRNQTRVPSSVHVHGLRYAKDSEGAGYPDDSGPEGDVIAPGETYTYELEVPERAGPPPNGPSSTLWMYHSHVDETADTYAGLIGPIIVTRRGMAREDGTPRDVDRELITLFHVYNENVSHYLAENVATYTGLDDPERLEELVEDPEFEESNLKHSINGYLYANLPGLTTRLGERVRWYAMAMGTEVDLHTPHWHGATVLAGGMRTDVIALLPAEMMIADMVPDVAGTWLYHCHVNDHLDAGMIAVFRVDP